MHPTLVGPIMATQYVTDHSSGHTKEWESLTPTRGATLKRGKNFARRANVLFYLRGRMVMVHWSSGPG